MEGRAQIKLQNHDHLPNPIPVGNPVPPNNGGGGGGVVLVVVVLGDWVVGALLGGFGFEELVEEAWTTRKTHNVSS